MLQMKRTTVVNMFYCIQRKTSDKNICLIISENTESAGA